MSDTRAQLDEATRAELEALMAEVVDESITDERFAALQTLLESSDAARRYYRQYLDMHFELADEANAIEAETIPVARLAPSTDRRALGGRPRSNVLRYATAAVFLIVAGLVVVLMQRGAVTDHRDPAGVANDGPPVATITDVVDAKWVDADTLTDLGSSVRPGRLQLQSGAAELVMESTARVTLLGPADVQMLGPNRCRLTHGRIVAVVPTKAHGFTVETPTHEVIDLGTRFGVDVTDMGETRVDVFEGHVKVRPYGTSDASAVSLTAGRSIAIDSATGNVSDVTADAHRFVAPQHAGMGVASSEPASLMIDGRAARDAGTPIAAPQPLPPSDSFMTIVLESDGVALRKPIAATLIKPGTSDRYDTTRPLRVRSGVKVRSYLIRFDPAHDPRGLTFLDATVRFDTPVLAVIAADAELKASGTLLGSPRVDYTTHPDGLEGLSDSQKETPDTVTLERDGRTLRLHFGVVNDKVDQIRVIVAMPDAETDADPGN
ncbi:MAG: hypothetical protein GC159_01885 [Phycisphaera sp.]|nr:hypothetical protein [Phycisphaera sp.]